MSKRGKNNSIMKKMLVPLIIIMILQAGIFCVAILWGGTVDQMNQNAFEILNERVINRKNYLQNEMIQRWSNLDVTADTLNDITSTVLEDNHVAIEELSTDDPVTLDILSKMSEQIIYLIRKNSVTGAFIILQGSDATDTTVDQASERKAGFYIRDLDPTTNSVDNSDLLIEVAPSGLTKTLGISLDSWWNPQFDFVNENAAAQDFYFQPFAAALAHPEMLGSDLGYWSKPFRLTENDIEVVTYSVPLIDKNTKKPYGVFGIELSADYLRRLLPYSEISADKKGSYVLAIGDGEKPSFEVVIESGPIMRQILGEQKQILFTGQDNHNQSYVMQRNERMEEDSFGCIQYFQLYNSNTPFENDRWALIGFMQEGNLFAFSNQIATTVWIALSISLLIGVVSVYVVSKRFTKPIASLANKVKKSNPHMPVSLEKINIREIDELAMAIENLSHDVFDSASKLSQIISMTDVPIAAFEYRKGSGQVFYTDRFFALLGIDIPREHSLANGYIKSKAFKELLDKYLTISDDMQKVEEIGNSKSYIFKIDEESHHASRWLRLNVVEEGKRILGVLIDVSREILEKRKIEYERDYDLLTNLLNRRAFHTMINKKFSQPESLKKAAFIMMDLDNLKYVNDTYGHDYGDEYIRCAANVLKRFMPYQTIISRMSGDEFYVFIYGYDKKETIRKIISEIEEGVKNAVLHLPDNNVLKLRASAGVAWYPDDSTKADELIRFADFAMYNVKNTVKGAFSDFDVASYNKDAYLLHSKEELNRFIEEELVDYYFQPIVDARTGNVFAYEALMRPKLITLKTPIEIITLARSQSKLYQIERLTWFKALEFFALQKDNDPNCKIFLNSISNQILSESDFASFAQKYQAYLSRIVLEFTEEEKDNEVFTLKKQEYIHSWHAEIALDDFGTGYNGDAMLLNISPEYVKIDMSIVRNIDKDENRQKIFQNLVSYSRERKIKVIAEGVETKEEMITLIKSGVDYLQGYYMGMPEPVIQGIPSKIKREILESQNRG